MRKRKPTGLKQGTPELPTEEYTVHYEFRNEQGFWNRAEETFLCNSKKAHKRIERQWRKKHAHMLGTKNMRLVCVEYQ